MVQEKKVVEKVKAGTVVKPCEGQCRTHKFQDSRYGQGRRLHNITKIGGTRCTVCGHVWKPASTK